MAMLRVGCCVSLALLCLRALRPFSLEVLLILLHSIGSYFRMLEMLGLALGFASFDVVGKCHCVVGQMILFELFSRSLDQILL